MDVTISKHCHCIKKLGLDKNFVCETKEEALKISEDILELMKKNSCHTHKLDIIQKDDNIIINLTLDTNNMDF